MRIHREEKASSPWKQILSTTEAVNMHAEIFPLDISVELNERKVSKAVILIVNLRNTSTNSTVYRRLYL